VTDTDYTAIHLLVDRSGSMASIRSDAEGGIKTFIEDQRNVPGKCTLRLAQFDHEYQLVYGSTPIADVPNPTLHPRGNTALLDAWGRAMTEFGEELDALPEVRRPAHVVFVVVTDGHENASRDWNREKVLQKVTEQTEKYGWQFLYLAAGQDAVAEGAGYGLQASSTLDWAADSQGAAASYSAASASVTRTRGGGSGGFTAAERKAAQGNDRR
jgi:hypothetical protein